MTRLTRDVKRETDAVIQGRPLMLEVGRLTIAVRLKGKRCRYEVPIAALWSLGAKLRRRELDAEKKAKRKAGRV